MEEVQINRKAFFSKLVVTLNLNEPGEFSLMEKTDTVCYDDDLEEGNCWEIYSERIFKIVGPQGTIITDSKLHSTATGVDSTTKHVISNQDEYITVAEALSIAKQLIIDYTCIGKYVSSLQQSSVAKKKSGFFRRRIKKN